MDIKNLIDKKKLQQKKIIKFYKKTKRESLFKEFKRLNVEIEKLEKIYDNIYYLTQYAYNDKTFQEKFYENKENNYNDKSIDTIEFNYIVLKTKREIEQKLLDGAGLL